MLLSVVLNLERRVSQSQSSSSSFSLSSSSSSSRLLRKSEKVRFVGIPTTFATVATVVATAAIDFVLASALTVLTLSSETVSFTCSPSKRVKNYCLFKGKNLEKREEIRRFENRLEILKKQLKWWNYPQKIKKKKQKFSKHLKGEFEIKPKKTKQTKDNHRTKRKRARNS